MIILEFITSTILGIFMGLWIADQNQKQRQQKNLEKAFYRLIEAQDGRISLIQLAATAQVDAVTAQQYLDQQVKIFSAYPEVDDDANTYYRFPQVKLPKTLKSQDW
ncbi:MAG: hypothetical protein WBA13_14115 [Microcoleaceae cyanobacterium]